MATARPTPHDQQTLAAAPAGRRSLPRIGAGVITGFAASLAVTVLPATTAPAQAAEQTTTASSQPAPTQASQQAVDTAKAQVGKPYQYGAAGPDSYDCSGLTQYAWASAGQQLPHSSRQQSELGTPVDRANLQPGDLVFYYEPVSHVGIYIGDGQIVHAGTEETGVEITSVDMEGYNSARRIA
jgi:cell wall-associated NlpC family hydrolase